MNAQSSIIPFTFENLSIVRTVLINNEPWFVVKDICSVLNILNPSVSVKVVDEDSRAKFNLGRQGETWIVNESGLYTLILRCDDAIKTGTTAYKFRRWVTFELIPSIRKTGHYEVIQHDKGNEFKDKEMQIIKDFLYRISNQIGYRQCFINACWYSLRQITGVKSPGKFRYSDVQVLMSELKRICFVTECYNNARREAEEAMFKKIIRQKGSFKELTEILGTMVTQAVDDSDLERLQKLDRGNVAYDIQNLQQRIGA